MLLRILSASLLAVSSLAYADITHLTCTQTGPTNYKLSYTLTGNTHAVQIYSSPNAQPSSGMQPVEKTEASTVTVHAGEAGQRIYFFLKADTGEQREVSIRHLPLEGTPNFRDLGGYRTTDGHFVRWGMLYRSGVLTYLTPADYRYLSNAGIRTICDFRTKQENAAAPERWIPGSDVNHVSLPIGDDGKKQMNTQMQNLLATNPTPDQLRGWMAKTYSSFAFTAAPQYAKLFAELQDEHLPLLYHCTAGKDRTGVFSAFILLSLGVPESTVLEDYALTNRYLLNGGQAGAIRKMNASTGSSLATLSPEQRDVLLAADPVYLKGTLQAIDAKYGSFDNYRRQELHVSDQDVTRLRARLLTN